MKTTLKEVREKLGMTQDEAANFLGVSRRSFHPSRKKFELDERWK